MSVTYRVASVRWSALVVLVVCTSWLGASAFAQSCSAPWPTIRPVFTSRIEYGDPAKKSDPYIAVAVNGKPANLLLDTGSNVHVLWDPRLIGETGHQMADDEKELLDAIASSTKAKRTSMPLQDATGNRSVQPFYLIEETPLMADGFSGIVSPQFLAQDNVSVLNFKDDCFFVSERFPPEAGGLYKTLSVGTIPNPHNVMAIPLDVPGGRVPVVVDSGAYSTTLLGSLMRRAALGRQRITNVDLLGNVVGRQRQTRLVDITVNGKYVRQHPVIPVPTVSEKGVVSFGSIGMDLLAGRVIFHDGRRNRFVFIEADAYIVQAR
ncbi:hypothetical protein DBB29_23620 [Pandoraea cepalis]|uniref:Aspartyl protease n=1 Tax=Pandoraea cepalis TaxID=2508294 RepID=A0AAW7MT92_9BURK|nr:hypothetical protein [Pandoraea cepalis]MDN4575999.1 hypothetical protein [Pandoraea cepalis]MDN4581101.1 hypothetical protein [Pandoraea cepalis]